MPNVLPGVLAQGADWHIYLGVLLVACVVIWDLSAVMDIHRLM